MPLLKDLNCSIELSEDSEPLQELGTMYGDGFVETFVPVPKKQQTFTVHLSGRNFIAPGIAMYVFIDGVYQCNRNRQNMKLRKPLDRRSLVDFKVRQKEERQKDGSMIAREWTFEKLDHASADSAPDSCSPNILESLGCIEVVVLRCAGPRNAKTAASMNMDGAADYPDYRFDRDSRSQTTTYDDRDPFVSAASHRLVSTPAATQYRSPYAETVRSREHSNKARSRYSEPVSPGARPQRDILAPGFQYGSGPLPARSTAETFKTITSETPPKGTSKPAATIDPDVFGKIVADAVKRGVEESRKTEKSHVRSRIGSERQLEDFEGSSQVPGAWPASPTHVSKHRSNRSGPSKRHERYYDRDDDNDSLWAREPSEQKRRPARTRSVARTAWDQEPEWDERMKANGWSSPDQDSWNTDETWAKARPEVRQRSKSRARTVRDSSPSRLKSEHSSHRRRSKHGRSQKSRSKSQSHWVDDLKTSSDDTDGWTPVEAPSDTSTSPGQSDSTLKPSHYRSQIQHGRSRSIRRGSRRERSRSRHHRRLSQLVEHPTFLPESLYQKSPPSMLVTNAPTVVAAPVWQQPTDVRSRKPSAYTRFTAPVAAPPPIWGCASEKARKNSAATAYLPPPAFSTVGEDHQQSRQSSGSSSWGIENKSASKLGSGKKSTQTQASSDGDGNSGKAKSTWGGAANTAAGWGQDQAKGWSNDATDQKVDDWNTDAKDENGWDVSNDTNESPTGAWNTDNNNASWDQADTKDAAVDGFYQDSNNSGWGHADTSKDDQNNGGDFGETNENGWVAVQDTAAAWDQPQNTANDVSFNADFGDAWAAPVAVDDKVAAKDKAPPTSKRHTSKSLSKYRQLSSAALAKPHWQFPPNPPKKTIRPMTNENASEQSGRTRRIPSVPSEPLYKVPKSAADEKGVEHQVLAGPGTAYGHGISRPEYMDRLDKPYAVFRFKYRSRSMLKSMFGNDCLSRTGTALKTVESENLKALPQEELIRKMLALQSRLAEKDGRGKESACTESVAKGLTKKWVDEHSREPSKKGKKAEIEKSADKVAAWDDGAKEWDPEKADVEW